MYKTLCAPITCQVEMTSFCNQNCGHCYNFWRGQKSVPDRHMSISEAMIVIQKLSKSEVFGIVLTGGEPLANFETTLFCSQEASSLGMNVSLNSNLTLLTNNNAKLLKKAGVNVVLTSLLSFDPLVHDQISGKVGSFAKVLQGIKIATSNDMTVVVNMVVSKKNINHVYKTAQLAKSLGAKTFTATKAGCPGNCFDFSEYSLDIQEVRSYIRELVSASEDFGIGVDILEGYPICGMEIEFFKRFLGRKCQAGITSMTIGSDGFVRPCSHLDIQNGNILNEDTSSIWKSMSEWRSGVHTPDVCKKCRLLPLCNGGCRMEAKMLSKGNITAIDPIARPERVGLCIDELKIGNKTTKADKKEFHSFYVVEGVRLRKESFGSTIVLNGKVRSFLDENGTSVAKQMIPEEVFFAGDPRINWGCIDPDSFVLKMASRGMVKLLP